MSVCVCLSMSVFICLCVCVCKAGKLSKSLQELDTNWSTETNLDVNTTSSVYVSTPSTRQVACRRPASMQLLDHYEVIPADLGSAAPTSPRRHASCDHIHSRPQPPRPDLAQGQRSSEVSTGRGVVDRMTRKPSYDDSDVILIESAIYG